MKGKRTTFIRVLALLSIPDKTRTIQMVKVKNHQF